MDCLFCKIASGQIPANVIYRDDHVVAFEDINPQAPLHLLVIPQKHIATLNDIHDENCELMGHMMQAASKLAKQFKVADEGYRIVSNCNAGAGQTVFHIHLHLLGGRKLTWPPG
jgi:histidine triad (HIT) family protein